MGQRGENVVSQGQISNVRISQSPCPFFSLYWIAEGLRVITLLMFHLKIQTAAGLREEMASVVTDEEQEGRIT